LKKEVYSSLLAPTLDFFHIGLTVDSLPKASKFFIELLDCSLLSERTLNGNYLGKVLGEIEIEGAKIAMLSMKNGPTLELVEYPILQEECVHPINTLGMPHIAHFVSDIELFSIRAKEYGAEPIGFEDQIIPAGPFQGKRIIFYRSPFNLILEIIETLGDK
jgi:catechol 2,3-dioxygenase-like lactoylglutathione lyase family enzyme